VLSALGLAVGDERRDHVRSEVRPLADVGDLPARGEADLRYRGQSFELTVPVGAGLADRFHELHAERYGYADPARPLELVAVRTAEVRPGPPLTLPARPRESAIGPATVELDGATCWIPPGWVGARDRGIWRITRA
jgi:N-methylhydantoinase A